MRLKIASFLMFLARWRMGWIKEEKKGRSLVKRLTRMGMFFVKVGQVMSVQHNWLSQDVIGQLRALQRNVPAGRPIINPQTLLARGIDVEPEPFACGSIACVYRGTYKGAPVAVKIVRASVQSEFEATRECMREFKRCTSWLSCDMIANLKGFMDVIMVVMQDQIDLTHEVANWRKLVALYDDRIVLPHIYTEVSDEHVICMEYIDGDTIEDIKALAVSDGTIFDKIFTDVAEFTFDSMLVTRTFHADAHPGNMFWRKHDHKLGFFDFGIVQDVDKALADTVLRFYVHMFARNVPEMAKALTGMLCSADATVERAIGEALRLRLDQVGGGFQVTQKIAEIVLSCKARLNHDATLINVNIMTMNSMFSSINDCFDVIGVIKRHIKQLIVDDRIDIDAVLA